MLHLPWQPTIRFCEANVVGLIAQPANSYSSLIISLAGLFILARPDRHSFTRWLGWTAIGMGLASFGYHASFTFIGQLADLGSMFLLGSFLLVAGLRQVSSRATWMIVGGGTVIPLALTVIFQTVGGFNIGIPLFALLLIGAIGLELKEYVRERHSMAWFGLAFLVLSLSFMVWLLDLKRAWCDPVIYHLINGHAIWHVGTAVALLLLDRHYYSLKKS